MISFHDTTMTRKSSLVHMLQLKVFEFEIFKRKDFKTVSHTEIFRKKKTHTRAFLKTNSQEQWKLDHYQRAVYISQFKKPVDSKPPGKSSSFLSKFRQNFCCLLIQYAKKKLFLPGREDRCFSDYFLKRRKEKIAKKELQKNGCDCIE